MPVRYKPSKTAAVFEKLGRKLNPTRLFQRARQPAQARSIYINSALPNEFYDKKGKVVKEKQYPSNQTLTSKYTVITFLPRNLFEQFRRVANVFFLGIAILQFFPKFSTISPGLVILPLLAVLAITGAKDGYEDIKRHQSDRAVNHSCTHVLSGSSYTNNNPMGSKSKTFVKGVKLPQSKKKKEKRRLENEMWGTVVRDDEAEVAGENGEQINRFPGEDLRGIRTREDEIEDGNMPRTAEDDPEDVGTDEKELGWKKTMWEDVKVGDFVKIYNNEGFPADVVICSTSEEENVAYIETKNLDGETNLKSRHGVPELSHLRSSLSCSTARFRIDCEPADVNMFRLNAAVVVEGQPGQGSEGGPGEEVKHPVNLETTLLRGCVLRNTAWVIGIVIFTGTDTKIVLNSGGTPSKRSKVERQMNPQVLFSLALLGLAGMVCGIVDHFNEVTWYRQNSYWTLYDDSPQDNPSFNGLVTFFNSLITFQNIVPISLYISIEFVRTAQAAFIYLDDEIWHKKTDTRTLARSWNLSDDLGQIEYIFSDKTGTLTQNAMIFQQCSIGGKVYKGDGKMPENVIPVSDLSEGPESSKISADGTAVHDGSHSPSSSDRPLKHDDAHSKGTDGDVHADGSNKPKVKLAKDVLVPFHDDEITRDLADQNSEQSQAIHGFFATLALCHTALASEDENGVIQYMAQSPDESALVQAAADVGFIFRGRDRNVLKMQNPFSDDIDEYELLNVLEFSSARKRMSVILRKLDDDRKIFLLTKGADNVVFERLAPGRDAIKEQTNKDLELFASEGLRTLCLGYRIIEEEEFDTWSRDFHDATVALDDRESKMAEVSARIEHSLNLLGATAIEDKLQDGVPEAIAQLKRAGIKVWVATGDKLETAISIGYSTNLLTHDSNLIIVRGGAYGTPNSAYDQMRSAIEQFFGKEIVDDVNYHPPELETNGRPSMSSRPSNQRRSSRRSGSQLHRTNSGVDSLVGDGNGERPGGFSLVVEGSALTHAFAEPWTEDLLLQLSTRCNTVICCRVSPLQKAQIVHLIKDNLGVMTLAIGDGANDVSMIQAADVGVGISGEEGLQAVNSSDYAIAQFRFLTRLLFVHGHWSYVRNSNMILNFFYKNIIGVGVLFFFQIYCAWSSTYVFEYVYLLLWNVVWSLAPVIAIGIFDRDLDRDVLVALPELYRKGREGKLFGMKKYLYFITEGIVQSAVIFFFINEAYNTTSARNDGYDIFMYEFSTTMVISAAMVCNQFHAITTHSWTGWVWFAVLIGPFLIWAFTAVYSALAPDTIITNVYGNYDFLFTSGIFWFSTIFVCILALAPRYLIMIYYSFYAPDDIEIAKAIRKNDPNTDFENDPLLGGHAKLGEKHDQPYEEEAAARPSMHGDNSHHSHSTSYNARPSMNPPRASVDMRPLGRVGTGYGSQIDMSTGVRTPANDRSGFDFSGEDDGGVAGLKRQQSRLSALSSSLRQGPARSRADQLREQGLLPAQGGRRRSGTLTSLRTRAGSVFMSKKRKDSIVSERERQNSAASIGMGEGGGVGGGLPQSFGGGEGLPTESIRRERQQSVEPNP